LYALKHSSKVGILSKYRHKVSSQNITTKYRHKVSPQSIATKYRVRGRSVSCTPEPVDPPPSGRLIGAFYWFDIRRYGRKWRPYNMEVRSQRSGYL